MTSRKGILTIAALILLAFVCHAATGSDENDNRTTTHAITVNATPLPDFDGDGTVGFSDFVIFADVFGARQGDGSGRYEAKYDLDGDGEIGFGDFLIFAGSFGKEPPSSGGGDGGSPDLVVQSPSVSNNNVASGATFTLNATVRNEGNGASAATTLRYYRSTDATIDATDTEVGTDGVSSLPAGDTSAESISLNAPSDAGTYYYGACVGSLPSERGGNNCSIGVRVIVEGYTTGGDLIVHPPLVRQSSVPLGNAFWMEVGVENIGTGPSGLTSVIFYRSDDATIDPATDKPLFGFSNEGLKASEWHFYSYSRPLSNEAGTYYIGVCAEPLSGETNIDNNCTIGVRVIVEDRGSPDLIVEFKGAKGRSRTTSGVGLMVRNIGAGMAAATVLRLYRSDDATIDPATDTQVRTDSILNIHADGETFWTDEGFFAPRLVPRSPGMYYYGLCVDPVPGESDTSNNCSEAMPMNVGVPDLAVGSAWASTSVPLVGESFTLTATVRNQGPNEAGSTTLRYYRSDDATIDATDTQVGTAAVSSLAAIDALISGPRDRPAVSGTSRESIRVSAPSSPDTYYYGACADPVPGEANTENNCSTGVYVRVVPSGDDPFNIELVILDDFTDAHKELFQQAARRWETIITKGLPDVNFSANPHRLSFGNETITVDDTVDDLRIFVSKVSTGPAGSARLSYVREGNPIGLTAVGQIKINPNSRVVSDDFERDLMLHEIVHVLGFAGIICEPHDLFQGRSGAPRGLSELPYFSGKLALQAFNAAGGANYSGNKVPLDTWHGDHWDPLIFGGANRSFEVEIMEPSPNVEHSLSAITIQLLADLGYVVDVSRADPFRLPASISTMRSFTASAKPVASQYCDLGDPGPIYVGDEQGNIIRILGD